MLSKPKILVDADVLFAGAASPSEHSASLVLLRMAEITLIQAFAPHQVIVEADRNLRKKMPQALSRFQFLVQRCFTAIDSPKFEDLAPYTGLADVKDLPILVAAIQSNVPYLVTFNIRHYQPGHPDVIVLRPGEYLSRVREKLTYLGTGIETSQ